MAARYVSVADVRVLSGITSTQVDDTDTTAIIEDIEYQIERYMNTVYTPKLEIDILDGSGKNLFFTRFQPLLSIRSLKDDGTSLTLSNIEFKRSGMVRLTESSTISNFKIKNNGTVVKYYYGDILSRAGGTETDTTSASTAGTSVALAVTSETGFATDNWIEIIGTDGNKESAKITGTSASTITVDELIYSHESGSLVKLLQIPVLIERLMKISAALAQVARVVGQSFDDIVGYTMGEFSVQKGEPYTQWRETAKQLMQDRDDILKRVQPKLVAI